MVARAVVGLLLHTIAATILEEGRSERLFELAEELLDFEFYGAVARD